MLTCNLLFLRDYGKQKCNNHKMKDKESSVILQDKTGGKLSTTEGKKYITEEMETVVEKPDTPEEILDVSDSVECFPDIHNHDSEGRYAHNGIAGRRSPALDDSSSTCSTDSTPSVMIMNTPYRGNLSNHKDQTSPSSKEKQKVTILDVTQLGDTSGSSRATGIELHASVLPSNDQLEVQKEVVILQQKGHSEAYTDGPSMNRTSVQSSPKDLISTVKSKPELKSSVHANNPSSVNKPVKSAKPSSQQVPYTAATPLTHQVSVTGEKLSSQLASRPFSAPIVARPRSATPVVSVAQTPPLTHSYVTRSYRNAMMGSPVTVSSAAVYDQPHPSSVVNPSQSYSQAPHALVPEPFLQRMVNHGMMRNGPQWIESPPQWDTRNFDLYKPAKCGTHDGLPSMLPVGTSSRQSPTVFTDDFPHLDIINDLLDDEHGLGMGSEEDGSSQCFSNGVHHLTRHSTFPGDHGISSDVGPSTDSCRLKRTQSCHDDFFQHAYSGTFINGVWDTIPDTSQPSSVNWQMVGSDPYHMLPDYSNLSSNQL